MNEIVLLAVTTALGLTRSVVELAQSVWERITGSKTFLVADGLLADEFYKRQCLRRVQFLGEVGRELELRGLPLRVLPDGFVRQAIEGGSYADDVDVRELWRDLLCNAVDDPSKTHPFVVETLRRMNGDDARSFRRACEATDALCPSGPLPAGERPAWGIDDPNDEATVRLLSARLVEPVNVRDGRAKGAAWVLTSLGRQFRRAVESPLTAAHQESTELAARRLSPI